MGLGMEAAGVVPVWVLYGVLAASAGLLLVAYWAGRQRSSGAAQRTGAGDRGDLLTAAIASAVAADGMWATFAGLDMAVPLRIATFAFIELAVVQSARRARRSMLENYSAGIDGIAMWVLTGVSAVLSAAHEATGANPNVAVVLVRLVAPVIAAWGWERNMALERRHRRGSRSRVTWRFTLDRIAVKLGLAEVGERGVDEVDAHRRLAKVARAADRARTLRDAGARPARQARALTRAKRAWAEADEYAKLSNRPELRQALLELVGGLYNVEAFIGMRAAPWWDAVQPGAQPDAEPQPVVVAQPQSTASEQAAIADAAGDAGASVPQVSDASDLASAHLPAVDRAREAFAGELERGEVPSLRRIQTELRVGQRRAQHVQAELRSLAS